MKPSTITVKYNGDCFGFSGPDSAEISKEDLQSVRQAHSIVGRFIEAQNPERHDTSIISEHHADVGRFLDRIWNTIPALTHTTTRTALKAEEVFNTTELLERIMLQLTTVDKLRAMQANWKSFETLCGSVSLRRALGVESYGDGHYYSPFSERFRGVEKHDWGVSFPAGIYHDEDRSHVKWDEDCKTEYYSRWADSRRLEVSVKISCDVDPSKFGRKIQLLDIFEPGVTEMRAEIDCFPRCHRLDPEGNEYDDHPGYLFTDEGRDPVTVGTLLDGAAWVRSRHLTCECTTVTFTAVLELEEDDPIVIARCSVDERAAKSRRAKYQASKAEHEAADENAEEATPTLLPDVVETGTMMQAGSYVGNSRNSVDLSAMQQQNVGQVTVGENGVNDGRQTGEIEILEEAAVVGDEYDADDGYDLDSFVVLRDQGF
ncbi:hypothetical protein HII31_00302 [Pseudocercospora fuligena]|uniref:Uncharacterized protein n=1 Tax=Pseudocercospora fuligena TaxID=685502 RepID=A0A8H6RXB9_9PEZI|nr:hypothetical protein HII31_00302 [Pseudocercospora fuligena]